MPDKTSSAVVALNRPAAFQSAPGVGAVEYATLLEALSHASRLTGMNRHPRAEIRTEDDARYDWHQIDELVSQFRIETTVPPSAAIRPRSSRM